MSGQRSVHLPLCIRCILNLLGHLEHYESRSCPPFPVLLAGRKTVAPALTERTSLFHDSDFFWCGPFFFLRLFIEFVTVLLPFMFWCFDHWVTGDLSFPSRDWSRTLCIENWSLNHWTTREVPHDCFGGIQLWWNVPVSYQGLLSGSAVDDGLKWRPRAKQHPPTHHPWLRQGTLGATVPRWKRGCAVCLKHYCACLWGFVTKQS